MHVFEDYADGTVVITFLRTVMVFKRGHVPEIPRPAPKPPSG